MTDSEPTLVNRPVAVVDAIIHGLIVDLANNAAIASAIAAQPWLGYPGIKQIFSWLVGWLAAHLSSALERTAAFAIIDSQTNAEAKAYAESIQKLKEAEKLGDPNALKAATDEARNALAHLIHYDGS